MPSPRPPPEKIGPYAYPEDFKPPEEDDLLADLDPHERRTLRDLTMNGADHDD